MFTYVHVLKDKEKSRELDGKEMYCVTYTITVLRAWFPCGSRNV